MNLIVQGGGASTFLLERLVAATGASTVEPRPSCTLINAQRTAQFDALIPLIEAEKLDWAFIPPAKTIRFWANLLRHGFNADHHRMH